MDWKRARFDARSVSGEFGGARVRVLRAQHECGRAVARHRIRIIGHVSLQSKCSVHSSALHADNRRITGEISGDVTGGKVLFCRVKRLDRMEIFRAENFAENAMRSPRKEMARRGGADIGNSTGRKSPVVKAQAIELSEYSGAKKNAENNALVSD
jgi:hypothetical protein